MPDIIKKPFNAVLVHKLTIWWIVFYVVATVCTAILGVLSTVKWATLDGQAKLCAGLSIALGISLNLSAFFNQAASRLKKGQDIMPDPAGTTSTPPFPGTLGNALQQELVRIKAEETAAARQNISLP